MHFRIVSVVAVTAAVCALGAGAAQAQTIQPGVAIESQGSFCTMAWVFDGGGNVYVVFSDQRNIYMSASSDRAVTWTTPVRVSNGNGSRCSVFPNVCAGSAGRILVAWYGTNSTCPPTGSPWAPSRSATPPAHRRNARSATPRPSSSAVEITWRGSRAQRSAALAAAVADRPRRGVADG